MNIRRHTWSITDQEFRQFQELLLRITGISLAPNKRALVCSRLARRLVFYQLENYGDYLALITDKANAKELQVAIDLLTTNETYFFREPRHFEFIRDEILPRFRKGRCLRVWSAACSSGEEPYSLAMLFSDVLGMELGRWELLASDISRQMLIKAKKGHYILDRTHHIPPSYMSRFCLKGVKSQEGTFLIRPDLRDRLLLRQINLNRPLPSIGEFDLVLLRNVLIYFNPETKRDVVARIKNTLKPGGYLIVGHSETLNGVAEGLDAIKPSIYRRPMR